MPPEILDYEKLEKAVNALGKALGAWQTMQDDPREDIRQTLQGGVVQAFEVAYDICWKAIYRCLRGYLDTMGTEWLPMSRKELLRLAGKHGLIDHVDVWLRFHTQRNETSHRYDENLIEDTLVLARLLFPEAKQLIQNLKSHH
jgi:nucleotidyltransferase substrate binding protein (TIGR01987 family)